MNKQSLNNVTELRSEEIRICLCREDDDFCDGEIVVYEASPVKYAIEFRGKRFVRSGMTAQEAVEKLCDQYGWRFRLGMYNADTSHNGRNWATGTVDTNGGKDFTLPVKAVVI